MTSDPEFTADLTGFTGTAPLFPLPDVVLFPHVALPLHIFEHRYREMVADAVDGEKLIAVALLKPGYEADYEGRPPIHEMVCLGRISSHERLESGKFNIVLTGIHRAVVTEELVDSSSYRTARLELYRDFYARDPVVDRQKRQHDLLTAFRLLFPRTRTDSLLNQVLEADLPLGVLSDLLGAVLKSGMAEKQALLDELDVDLRSELLLKSIRKLLASRGTPPRSVYPPRFSLN